MKIIGIAGESGTGKSTIGDYIASRGGVHIDADRLGHEVLESDASVIKSVRKVMGPGVFDGEGKIDRRLLGELVFSDPSRLAALNNIIHPSIRRRCGEIVRESEKNGATVVAVDAALLLDSKMPFAFDLMIALRCDPEIQLQRLLAEDIRDEAEIRARLANQDHIEKSFYKADVVVDTGRDKAAVFYDIDRLLDKVMGNDAKE